MAESPNRKNKFGYRVNLKKKDRLFIKVKMRAIGQTRVYQGVLEHRVVLEHKA
jgi:hypothetical protein